MGRKRKRKRNRGPRLDAPQATRGASNAEANKWLADFWSCRIRAGLEAQKAYRERAEEVMEFFKSDHSGALFEDEGIAEGHLDFAGTTTASVPLVARMHAALVPRLNIYKPTRTVNADSTDTVVLAWTRVLETYLKKSVNETKHSKEMRAWISDATLRGRGVMRTGWDPDHEMVTSWGIHSLDFVTDPDFTNMKDAQWIAWRVREPLWRIKRRYPKDKTKDLSDGRSGPQRSTEILDESRIPKETDSGRTSDQLEVWVIYSKMGKGFRGGQAGEDEKYRRRDKEDFVRVEVVIDHSTPLEVGEWDIPYYEDNDWPITLVEFIELDDEPYPDSIFGQVVSSQKAIDLITTQRLHSCKNRDRTVVVYDTARLSPDGAHQLTHGTLGDAIPVESTGNQNLKDVVHVVDFGAGDLEGLNERQFHLEQMEQTTGVTPALHGGDEGGAKDRSATATQLRQGAAATRVGELKNRVHEAAEEVARKEALSVVLDVGPEELDLFVKPHHIGMFYVRVELPGGELPVRSPRGEKEAPLSQDEEAMLPLSLEEITPEASRYFEAPEESLMAAQQLWADLQEQAAEGNTRVISIVDGLVKDGIDSMDQLPVGIDYLAEVTASRVMEDLASRELREVFRETSYEVTVGKGIKIDQEQLAKHASDQIAALGPILMQAGPEGIVALNGLLARQDAANDVPLDERVQIPIPPPMPPPGEEGGGGQPPEEGE